MPRPINRNPNFFTNWIYYWETRFCSYAFSLKEASDICKTWKYQPLKYGFRLILQKFCRAVNLWWVGQKTYQKFLLISAFKKLYCQVYCYLGDIQWNEVTSLMACNLNNSWLLYLSFSNMINLCPHACFTENSKCGQFIFWIKCREKKDFSFL